MGALFSRFEPAVIDGRGTVATPETPLYNEIVQKTPDTKEKLHQLLRALVNYEPTNAGAILISMYFMGADKHKLSSTFETFDLRLWPEENAVADSLGDSSLKDFYGNWSYLKRYFEFFRDQLTEYAQWHEILAAYVPVMGTRLVLAEHGPLHLLGAAVEIDDPVLAMYALAWACAAGKSGPNGTDPASWLALEVLKPLADTHELEQLLPGPPTPAAPSSDPRNAVQTRAQLALAI